MSMPVLIAWSGGKDSALALERLLDDPERHVSGLLTTLDGEHDRVTAHGVRRSVLHAQAAALGLPLYEAHVLPGASNEAYEHAFAQALVAARQHEPGLDTIAFGDLYLEDVRAWREAMLARLGWHALFPLWGEDTGRVARTFIARGNRAILCCVDTTQLDAAFCGRDYDARLLRDLPASCDPCGENGEFHTCVVAGPWPEPLALVRGERTSRDGRFQYVDLAQAAE
jgi:uncharacterized protein (TIGR00290 family)